MPEKSILVVEDEPSIAEVVSLYLRRAGYQVQSLGNGLAAQEALEQHLPDLVVMDLMLPGLDGLSLTRWLRERSEIPIIMLTSRREEIDRIAGLEIGADDYVVKPFSPQELVSRVRAVLRRAGGEKTSDSERSVVAGSLKIDPLARSVVLNGAGIELTAKEFDMLYLLVRHPRQVFSRDHLLENVWGTSEYIDPGTVTVHVRRIREKIEADPANPALLLTVWGVGYKFEPAPEQAPKTHEHHP
ncbi:MAG TPA: response regulator transcription factor [Anaerolineales bacterium]|jgi:DNA-binding response OmpR family regulator